MSVLVPAFDTDLELADNLFQQGWKRRLIDTQDDPGIAHVAKQHGETQTIGRAAPLPDDGQIAFTERVVADQLILASGNANRLCFSIAERIERRGIVAAEKILRERSFMQLQPAVHCREALRAAKIYCKIKLNGNKKSQSCISVMLASRCKNKTPKPKLRLLELWAANGYFRKRHRAVAGIALSYTGY